MRDLSYYIEKCLFQVVKPVWERLGGIKRLLWFFLFMVSVGFTNAQELTTHYIVAFDQSVPLYRNEYLSGNIIKTLDKILDENEFRRGKDYISIVGYSLEHTPSMERFVRPYKDIKNNDILWKRYKYPLTNNMEDWPSGQPVLNLESGSPSSIQSIAKPYAIMETKGRGESGALVDRTVLLMVTDEVINGADDNYRQEWNRVKAIAGSDIPAYCRIEDDVFLTMRKFNEEYKFVQEPIKYNGNLRDKIPLSVDGGYKIVPYEVVPVEKPSIHAVTDMPSPIPLKRVKGGFRVNANVKSINPKYTIKDITVFGKKGEMLGQSATGDFDFLIPSGKISEGDTINVAMSLLLKDGFYDASILSYKNDRYKSGMTNKQVVKLQDEAKVMGLIPLSDKYWWWFPNDIFSAVMIWDLIILLIGIVIIGVILYICFVRINLYRPSNDKLKITKI